MPRACCPRATCCDAARSRTSCSTAGSSGGTSAEEPRPEGRAQAAGFRKELILANVKGLERLVSRLDWQPAESTWSGYAPTTSYSSEDADRKARFVAARSRVGAAALVWDLGCNEGRHARIAAEHADCVVAMDADAVVADRLYGR